MIFATVDPALGRAGHRAFVVEKGTPGFFVGKIEEKMGLRANETAELVLEDCRVPAENLLGGEEKYQTKEGFMTAMKTFDNTRPLVAAMACGIGRAAYEYAPRLRQGQLRAVGVPSRATRPSPSGSRGSAVSSRRRACSPGRPSGWPITSIPNAKEASMTQGARRPGGHRACIDAIEICGAHGTLTEDHALLEKWFRDIKVYDIFEGTGQIQRIVISKRLLTDLKAF